MYRDKFNEWLNFDEETKAELVKLRDEEEIEDRFYKDLAFGTGGLRGVMGAGTNRMNSYTVKKASLGLANFVKRNSKGNQAKIVIAYDTRNKSKDFAEDAAMIFSSLGIKTHLFSETTATPILSFAVRYFDCDAGIVITASHNPKEYNGYKVYDNNGGQLTPDIAQKVIAEVNKVTDYKELNQFKKNEQFVSLIDNDILEKFLDEVKKQSFHDGQISVTYTPIHGAGNIPVKRILQKYELNVVEKQESPDGDFPTVSSPNPEEREALNLAIEEAETNQSDIVLGTDPDCDRVGVAVRHENEYALLTGNQIGALLVDYVLTHSILNEKSTLIKTIVTNDLGAAIAKKKGLIVLETLTGFKYIGEKMNQFDLHKKNEFVVGYEESYGYLVGHYARDKDAVVSSMLICEMAAYHKDRGITLIDRLKELYSEYGFYQDALDSLTLKGKNGAKQIDNLMIKSKKIGTDFLKDIVEVKDYSLGIDELPKENVLKFILEDGTWIAIRPSGTEPKIKFYYSIVASEQSKAEKKLKQIKKRIEEQLSINLPN